MTRRRSVRSGFEQRLLANLRASGVVSDSRLVVGFSGGVDSLALAAALQRIAPRLNLAVLLVHVDHQLRPGAPHDAALAADLAATLQFPIEIAKLESGLAHRSRGRGIEEQARRERYLALAAAARTWSTNMILLGHQANDQAETLLLHLFRGAGLRGIAAMSPVEERTIPWWNELDGDTSEPFRILRPLLRETRCSIEQYAAERGLSPIQDPSNQSSDFDRNWIRHELLPLIETRRPSVVETLCRAAASFRIDESYLAEMSQIERQDPNHRVRTLCTDDILGADRAIAYRRIHRWLQQVGVEEVGFDVVERCYIMMATHQNDATIEAGSGISIILVDGVLTTLSETIEEAAATFPLDTGADVPGWIVTMHERSEDADGFLTVPPGLDLEIRALHLGDRWFGSERPVNEDLRVAGISSHLRDRVLCVAAGDGVLLIPAIYPTIRSELPQQDGEQIGIRWRRME